MNNIFIHLFSINYMKEGKAQATIFIILAISIVAIIGIFFLVKSSDTDQFNIDTSRVYSFTESCIKQTATEIIYDVGEQGGYYFAPEPRTSSGIPYYNSKNLPPKIETIEKEISLYTKEKLPFCTKNFLNFNDLTIKQGEIEVTTKIKDNEIIINTIYPIQIEKDGSTAYLRDFNDIQIPIRLGTIKKAVDEIAINQRNKEGICLDCLINVTEKYDLYIDMTDFEEGIVIFIKDKQSIIDEEKFLFIFATEVDPIE